MAWTTQTDEAMREWMFVGHKNRLWPMIWSLPTHVSARTCPFGTAGSLSPADGIRHVAVNSLASTACSVPWTPYTPLKHNKMQITPTCSTENLKTDSYGRLHHTRLSYLLNYPTNFTILHPYKHRRKIYHFLSVTKIANFAHIIFIYMDRYEWL